MTTTNEGTQRDELAQDIAASLGGGNASVRAITNVAEALITKGYRKHRTITTVEELDALPEGSVVLCGDQELYQRKGAHWYTPDYVDYFQTRWVTLPVTVLHEPEAEVGA